MPCYTQLKPRQTIKQRAEEVKRAAKAIDALLQGPAKAIVDRKTGAIAFIGIPADIRDDLTDACIFRQIMANGSATARAAIVRAETLAGRTVDKQTVAAGVHSHDGGSTWHNHKG